MLPVTIAGLGWYLPEQRITNDYFAAQLDVSAGWIERATGVRERRYASAGETSAGMAAAAARMALASAGIHPDDLDAIVGASAAPQQAVPCTAALIQHALGAPDGGSVCWDVNATCLSFLFALQSAAHLVAAGVYRTILICSSEITSPSLNPNDRETRALFGDGAAAAIITRSGADDPGAIWHTQFATFSSGAHLTEALGGGTLHHPADPATTREHNSFRMQGMAVFKFATRQSAPFLDRFFQTLGWERSTIDLVVPHQASRHAIDQLADRLGFRREQIYSNLAERGNCVGASIPLALAEAVAAGRIRRGDRVLLVGTGAGLTLGGMALTF
ncbi:MAG TPA: ketoacyl-ACP synthase III [Herpetosiphonaceae bacterium]